MRPTPARSLDLDGVDGLFVGRAALDPETFIRIASIKLEGGRERD